MTVGAVLSIAQGLLVRSGHGGVLLALSPIKLAVMLCAGLLVARLAPHANGAMLAIGLFIGGDVVDALLFGAVAARLSLAAQLNENQAPVDGRLGNSCELGSAA